MNYLVQFTGLLFYYLYLSGQYTFTREGKLSWEEFLGICEGRPKVNFM